MVDEAVERSREGGLIERVDRYVQGSAVNEDIDPGVSYSDEAIDDFVAELAEEINRSPRTRASSPAATS